MCVQYSLSVIGLLLSIGFLIIFAIKEYSYYQELVRLTLTLLHFSLRWIDDISWKIISATCILCGLSMECGRYIRLITMRWASVEESFYFALIIFCILVCLPRLFLYK